MIRIVGSYVSPYVRKVLACLNLKGLPYEIDPITSFYAGDDFTKLSPLRRIPALIDGDVTLCDSSVICAYLDEAYAGPALMPKDPKDRARARWLEEYADTRLGDLFIWGLFYQKCVHHLVWGAPGDQARIEKTLSKDLPAALDYLETELPGSGFLFGDMGIADVAIASFFRNGIYAEFETDPVRWPKAAAFAKRALAHPAFAALLPFEDVQRSVEIKGRRKALIEAGAPLTATTYGGHEPRRGVMPL